MFERFKRYVRKNTNPIKPEIAWMWKTRLSIIYAFAAWNVLGFTVYYMVNEKMDGKTGVAAYAKLLGVSNAHVIKFSNTTKVAEYELNLSEQDTDKFNTTPKQKVENEKASVVPSGGYWNRRAIDYPS